MDDWKKDPWLGGVVLLVGILYVLNDLNMFYMPVSIWHLLVFLLGLKMMLVSLMEQKGRGKRR